MLLLVQYPFDKTLPIVLGSQSTFHALGSSVFSAHTIGYAIHVATLQLPETVPIYDTHARSGSNDAVSLVPRMR